MHEHNHITTVTMVIVIMMIVINMIMRVKSCHKPPIWEWLENQLSMVMTGGWFIIVTYDHITGKTYDIYYTW